MFRINFQFWKYLFALSQKFRIRFKFLAEFVKLEKYFKKNTRRNLFWLILKTPHEAEDWLNIKRFLYDINDLILVDIGANIGQFTNDFNYYFNPKISYCYEPVLNTYEKLRKNTKNSNVRLFNNGISEKKREVYMKVGSDSTLSSIYSYQDYFIDSGEREYQSKVLKAQFNNIKNIDICVGDIFLKIDVQGMEEDTLKGCKEILPRVKAILIETSFISEFKNVRPSFPYICKYLIDYGFYPICFQSYGTLKNIYPYERDVLFVKKNLLNRILN